MFCRRYKRSKYPEESALSAYNLWCGVLIVNWVICPGTEIGLICTLKNFIWIFLQGAPPTDVFWKILHWAAPGGAWIVFIYCIIVMFCIVKAPNFAYDFPNILVLCFEDNPFFRIRVQLAGPRSPPTWTSSTMILHRRRRRRRRNLAQLSLGCRATIPISRCEP